MISVYAASRGKGLADFIPPDTRVHIDFGGKLHELRNAAESSIPPNHGLSGRRMHFYFLCGIPDITSLLKEPEENYRESIFIEDPEITKNRYQNELLECQRSILERGAVPIFCTIPSVNIDIYNKFLLSTGKTSKLCYANEYEKMQENIEKVIGPLNAYIYRLNNSIKVSTPFLHDTIREKRGRKKNRYYMYKWDKFYDGLHPPSNERYPRTLLNKWGDLLTNAFQRNEDLEDSDEEPPTKRYCKFTPERPRENK